MQKQTRSMKQQYKPDSNLSYRENEILQRLHNNDETLKETEYIDSESGDKFPKNLKAG